MLTSILTVLILSHPDYPADSSDEKYVTEQFEELRPLWQEQASDRVKELAARIVEVMLVDCRVPAPPDDPSFRDPRRFLHMLQQYWDLCRQIILDEMNASAGYRPHGLLPLIINLRDRIRICIEGIPHEESRKFTDCADALMDVVVEGDVDDLQVVEEWSRGQLQQADAAIEALRLKVGGWAHPLTDAESMFLSTANDGVAEYRAHVSEEWGRVRSQFEAKVTQDDRFTANTPARVAPATEDDAVDGAAAPAETAMPQSVALDQHDAKGEVAEFELSATKRDILQAVNELGANTEAKKVFCPAIAERVGMNADTRLRTELAALRALRLLGGKKGERGYWLTPVGIRLVER